MRQTHHRLSTSANFLFLSKLNPIFHLQLGLLNAIQVRRAPLSFFTTAKNVVTPHRVAEYRLPLRIPLLPIRDRWSRSSFCHSYGSHHHAHRHRTPKRIQLCEHVYWCTVRLLFSILAVTTTATEEGCVLIDVGLGLDRFLIGFGLTFAASAAPLLISEIAYPSQRGQVTSMYNSMWYLGSIM